MSFTNVILYLIGLVVFGFVYWLLNGITDILKVSGIHNATDFTSYDILMLVWGGIVVVYLIFGGIWVIRSFSRKTITGGYQ